MPKILRPERTLAEDLEDLSSDQEGISGSSPSVLATEDVSNLVESGDSGSDDNDSDDLENEEDNQPQDEIRTVSFSTLAKAQESISKKRKRDEESMTTGQHERTLDAIRHRLYEIKKAKLEKDGKSLEDLERWTSKSVGMGKAEAQSKMRKSESQTPMEKQQSASPSNSDTDNSDHEGESQGRSSKHAPTSQSSKFQVSRKRSILDKPKSQVRDPRFDSKSTSANSSDPSRTARAYSFLDDYRDDEIDSLKKALKTTKSSEEKEKLKEMIMTMVNKKRSQADKERAQKVIRDHRRKDREAIETSGKKPFYLKKSEQKRLTEEEKVKGMKKSEIEKRDRRKTKKEAGKEKKRTPLARRIVG